MKIITILVISIILSLSTAKIISPKLTHFVKETDSDIELFMQTFIGEAYGMQVPMDNCHHDSEVVKTLINSAIDLIKDGTDYNGIFESIQYFI